jgi:glycosyltransferase involved in cell wall biosynthesis
MLEAISMAKPIITTDAAGCRDTVIDGINGYMVPVKDWEALAAAMKKMLEADKETLVKMGEEGRKLALREFDEKMVVKRYIDVIAYLIAKGNAK